MDHTSQILVSRLAAVYDPFQVLFGRELCDLSPDYFDIRPEPGFVEIVERDVTYHRGRIAYLVEAWPHEPIEVDNDWHRWGPGGPIVVDGHHRLCAAILAHRRRIACSYSGAMRTLRWLEGQGAASDRPWR